MNIYETETPWAGNTAPPDSFGYLRISVAAALRALPLMNAQVSVYSDERERAQDLLAVLTTNESGLTEQISLPAPLLGNSLTPDQVNPYNLFYVRIVAADYVTRDRIPVQIFPGIISDLVVNMQPPIR
ncbi:MAG: hypothetical protein IJB67_06080 [Firmicutes bacterium]|nr:hypothetical protein [Bacillota bacterium]